MFPKKNVLCCKTGKQHPKTNQFIEVRFIFLTFFLFCLSGDILVPRSRHEQEIQLRETHTVFPIGNIEAAKQAKAGSVVETVV